MDDDTLSEQLYQFLKESSPQSFSTGRLVNLFGAPTAQITAILLSWTDDTCVIQVNSRSIRYEAPIANPVPARFVKPFTELKMQQPNPRCKELYDEGFGFVSMGSIAEVKWREI